MHNVSVIIPVFNAGEYIDACLQSIAAQTMDNIQVIFIDDHGTDDSVSRIKSFVDGYSGNKTFLLISTEDNSGPGMARNAGIDAADGEYVVFVDSDDYVEPGFCEELWKAASEADADLACCDIVIGGEEVRNIDVSDKKYFLKHFVSHFTTFIYRKTLLDGKTIRFPESKSAEDTCFLTCCVLAADKMVQVHKPLYYYVLHNESVSGRKNRKRGFERLTSVRGIIAFAKDKGYYADYKCDLWYLLLKKGYALAIKDFILG